jgi:hypothetical protein
VKPTQGCFEAWSSCLVGVPPFDELENETLPQKPKNQSG